MVKEALASLFMIIFSGIVYDVFKHGVKGSFLAGIPYAKKLHHSIYERQQRALGNLQYSYDFYAEAFSVALLFGFLSMAFGIDLALRWYFPADTILDDTIYVVESVILFVTSYVCSLWLLSIRTVAKSRIDFNNEKMAQSGSGQEQEKKQDDFNP